MPTTPRLGLVYPALADDPDVPDDLRKLAVSIEAASIGWVAGDFKFSFQTADHDAFILCDGNARLRADLPAPFLILMDAVLGIHPDPTRVRIPNLRRRSPMGADPGGASINGVTPNLGAIAGEESHHLLIGEVPSHDHGGITGDTNNFIYVFDEDTQPDDGNHINNALKQFWASFPAAGLSNSANHHHGIAAVGGDAPHNNVAPVLFGNWFIATGGGGSGGGGGGGGGTSASGLGGTVNLVADVRQDIVHDLGTRFVSVTTWDNVGGEQVDAGAMIVDDNTISLLAGVDIAVDVVIIPAAGALP
jgi:microcystin-dependent protein